MDFNRDPGAIPTVPLVIIESPYSGNIERNTEYARLCMADSIQRGEFPFASHLLYPQPDILNESVLAERKAGIEAGYAWGEYAHVIAVYTDLGVSLGMLKAVEHYAKRNKAIVYRTLQGWKWKRFLEKWLSSKAE